ncbi:hypothetical protein B0H14DRAFT_3451072 [Mycena olivaceomarginata]|nr:hypothetical protein B0H14DRAFT_3451072 [Mycena olivaceomarginata]
MFEYLSCTGGFQGWASARDDFEQTMSKDPIAVWTALESSAGELASFAITVLRVVSHRAGKTREATKVDAQIKVVHLAEGVVQTLRRKRKNHKSVEKLLSVPRYRDLLQGQDTDELIAAAAEIVKAATPTPRLPPVIVKKATKTTLAVLFGGMLKHPVTKLPSMEVDRE